LTSLIHRYLHFRFLLFCRTTPKDVLNVAHSPGLETFSRPTILSVWLSPHPEEAASIGQTTDAAAIHRATRRARRSRRSLGRGQSILGAAAITSVGSTPDSVASIQLGNGDQAVLSANFNSNSVSVLKVNADGTLTPVSDLATETVWIFPNRCSFPSMLHTQYSYPPLTLRVVMSLTFRIVFTSFCSSVGRFLLAVLQNDCKIKYPQPTKPLYISSVVENKITNVGLVQEQRTDFCGSTSPSP
jgi:hypothetical protein